MKLSLCQLRKAFFCLSCYMTSTIAHTLVLITEGLLLILDLNHFLSNPRDPTSSKKHHTLFLWTHNLYLAQDSRDHICILYTYKVICKVSSFIHSQILPSPLFTWSSMFRFFKTVLSVLCALLFKFYQ